MIALSSFLCGLHCQRQLYGLIFTKKQIVQERSTRRDLWHFGFYCGVVRPHPQFHQHVDVIFSLGYKVANCLGSFEFKTTLVVMMVGMIVTKALEELDVKADLHPELFVNGTDHSRHAPNIQSHYTDIANWNWKGRESIIEQRRLFTVST